MATRQTVVPCSLTEGDNVALVAPAGPTNTNDVAGASRILRQWGLNPVTSRHCCERFADYGGAIELSADDANRLNDLQWAINNESVKAILCCRGGYGTLRLIDGIDLNQLHTSPKWVIGYSDITALHAALHHEGFLSLHAPMTKYMAEHGTDDKACSSLHTIIRGGPWPSYQLAPATENRTGTATAALTGGNLAVLSALVPSKYNMISPGDIVFVENVGDSVSRVERMLLSLRFAGLLPHLSGLVVGRLSGQSAEEESAMRQMVARMVSPYNYPVAFGLQVGHHGINLPLIIGATTTLSVTRDGTSLTQHSDAEKRRF